MVVRRKLHLEGAWHALELLDQVGLLLQVVERAEEVFVRELVALLLEKGVDCDRDGLELVEAVAQRVLQLVVLGVVYLAASSVAFF